MENRQYQQHNAHGTAADTAYGVEGTQADASHQHRYGRDAGLAAGGLGAVSLAEHEHHKHQTNNPNTATATGPGYGAQGAQAIQPDQHHYVRDAAIGAGGLGTAGVAEHEHHKHHHERQQHHLERQQQAGVNNPNTATATGPGYGAQGSQGTQPTQHHYGRDAAIGAGGLGAAGLAEHEHRKHEQTASTTAGPSYGAQSTQPTQHHYGGDAAIGAGGLGAAGVAEHEHNRNQQQANLPVRNLGPIQKGDTVMSQVLNPGLERANPVAIPAVAPGQSQLQGIPANTQTQPDPAVGKEHGILRQIFNPRGDKVDPLAYGAGVQQPGAATGAGNAPYNTTGQQHDHHLGRDAVSNLALELSLARKSYLDPIPLFVERMS